MKISAAGVVLSAGGRRVWAEPHLGEDAVGVMVPHAPRRVVGLGLSLSPSPCGQGEPGGCRLSQQEACPFLCFAVLLGNRLLRSWLGLADVLWRHEGTQSGVWSLESPAEVDLTPH